MKVLTREAVCSCGRHVVEHKCRGVVAFVLCSEVCYLARPAQDAAIVQSWLRVRFALKTKADHVQHSKPATTKHAHCV